MADQAPPQIAEGYREKMIRKLKTEPYVPIGALLTTGALIAATTKMRRGDQRSMNRWLRVRVVAQGITVAAICAGSFTFATHKPPTVAELSARAEEHRAEERREFAERMKEAEEAEREEARFRPAPAAPTQETAQAPPARTVLKRKTYADKTNAAPAAASASASAVETAAPAATADAAQTEASQKTGGSWASWFGFGRGSGASADAAADERKE